MIGLAVHHFGIGTTRPEKTLLALRALGYVEERRVRDELQGVDLIWCIRGESPAMEIVSAIGPESPLQSIFARQLDAGLYHLCFEMITPLAETLAGFESRALRVITVREPLPAILFDGREVSFHMIQGLGLVELLGQHPTKCGA